MTLIDKYLKNYDYNEIHRITVKGNTENCYYTTLNLDLSKSKIISVLFRLRTIPFSATKLNELAENMKFTFLEENKYSEFIYGFWTKSKVEWIDDVEEFINEEKGYQFKCVWNFQFLQIKQGECEIITETRVKCLTKRSKIFFSIYWFFIKPFSGLIRKKMLNLIKHDLSANT